MKPRRSAGLVAGATLLALTVLSALAAPLLSPHHPDARFPALLNAPPTRIHVITESGRWRSPFIYPWRRLNQLEQQYELDRTSEIALQWFADGHPVNSSEDDRAPLLLLGADSFGRDVFSRLLFGARLSLGLAAGAGVLALLLGSAAGGAAGYAGGVTDTILMRGAEFIIVLPVMYVVLALRAVMPMVLSSSQVFATLLAIFSVLGAPAVARGVRAIVQGERRLDYVVAAEALGSSRARLLFRHLLPAARGFLLVQLTLMIPAFIVAEATLSFVGLGFPDPAPSWGTMLQEASTVRALVDFPWLLSPAVILFVIVFCVNLLVQDDSSAVGRIRSSGL